MTSSVSSWAAASVVRPFIPLSDERSVAHVGRFLLDLPEGADALSGSFPIFPTILCAQSPMARQDPRLVARSSSVSPAIPSRSGVEG